jgi:hypothetical protein
MNAYSLFAHLLRPRLKRGQTSLHLIEAEQVICVPPMLSADDLPPEFKDVLEVQVLGYRERLTQVDGHRQRVLDPVWTIVPKGR